MNQLPVLTEEVSPGQWWVSHHRARAAESGVGQVARNLRKQGVPLWVALRILATCPAPAVSFPVP